MRTIMTATCVKVNAAARRFSERKASMTMARFGRTAMVVVAGVAGAGLLVAVAPDAAAQAQGAPSKTGGAAQVAGSPGAEQFSSANDALQALVAAATAKDRDALAKIFGPDYPKLLSGDQIEDDKDLGDFADAAQASAKLLKDGDAKYTVLVWQRRLADAGADRGEGWEVGVRCVGGDG